VARPWPEIVDSGRLRVAVKDNLRPLGFRTPQGDLQGFEIELACELGSRLLGSAEAVELVPVSNVERLQVLADGQVDLAIAQIGITPDRARQVEFTSAYYQDGTQLGCGSFPQLGKLVGLAGRSRCSLARFQRHSPAESIPARVELVPVDSYREGAELLLKGAVQGWAADRSVLAGWLAEHPRRESAAEQQFQFLGSPLATVGLGIAMPKGLQHAELRLRVRRELENLRAEGWLAERARAWGLP
jgi:polar amino acid transport system substrate-binding protein